MTYLESASTLVIKSASIKVEGDIIVMESTEIILYYCVIVELNGRSVCILETGFVRIISNGISKIRAYRPSLDNVAVSINLYELINLTWTCSISTISWPAAT